MSDPESEIPSPIGPNSRRRTFDTGATPTPEQAPSQAKNILRKRIREDVIVPIGTFKYQEFASCDEIRILRLLKGKREDKIECSLILSAFASSKTIPSTSTADNLPYQALSCWWGPGEERSEILIHTFGKKGWAGYERRTFYIRANLEAALRQLRSQKKDVDIWVDAICINQKDKKEKTAQVSRMNEIYTEAESVCIWLGAGSDNTAATFKFLKQIVNLQKLDELITSGSSPEKWGLIVQLMENRWFSRLWVIQELTLARKATVRWGKEQIPWSKFSDAIALFMTKHDRIKEILSTTTEYPRRTEAFGDARALGANTLVNATNNLFRKSEDGSIQQRLLTLEMLVTCQFLGFEASDPRDIIYALLSVAKDTSFALSDMTARTSWMIKSQGTSNGLWSFCRRILFHLLSPVPATPAVKSADDVRISPNYDKCLVDVCADFMDYCIETSQSLDIICRHWAPTPQKKTEREMLKPGAESEEVEILPTWIPSIKGHAFGDAEDALQGRSNGDSLVGTVERQNQQHYDAAAGLLPWVEFGRCVVANNSEAVAKAATEPLKGDLLDTTGAIMPRLKKFDRTLYIKGFRLGTITDHTGRFKGIIPHEAFEMCGLKLDSESQKQPENVLDKVPDQLWRTLVADRGPNGTNAPPWYHVACLESLWNVDQNGDLDTAELRNPKKTPTTIVSFLERVLRIIWNRKFFQCVDDSKKHRKPLFGLAPPTAKRGDVVCVIFGCSVPVLLRECNDAEDTFFELVGECYVHGYMDGQAIPRERTKYPYPEAEKFNLR